MKYCKRCLLPSTKPGLTFNKDGVCSACTNYENRENIDWLAREEQLKKIFDKYRTSDDNWDCIVPVSGGKDSTYQVLTALKYGMTPLCVTGSTCDLSEIGRENIENLKNLGVDYIEFSSNPVVRRKINYLGLVNHGDISLPEHMSIFTIPLRVAVKFGISLILWGENSVNEYGGDEKDADSDKIKKEMLDKWNIYLGMTKEKLLDEYKFKEKDILPFLPVKEEDILNAEIREVFLGHYLPWDGYTNAMVAQAHGMKTFGKRVESTIVDYENLDNYQTGIHDYFKYLKFGYGRATDIASLHIRRNRMSREMALELVKKYDGNFPWTYLDKPLEKILENIGMDIDEFVDICDKYTNKDIFMTDNKGKLIKDKNGNLKKKKYDND